MTICFFLNHLPAGRAAIPYDSEGHQILQGIHAQQVGTSDDKRSNEKHHHMNRSLSRTDHVESFANTKISTGLPDPCAKTYIKVAGRFALTASRRVDDDTETNFAR